MLIHIRFSERTTELTSKLSIGIHVPKYNISEFREQNKLKTVKDINLRQKLKVARLLL